MSRILVYDLENMAICGWGWGLYDQNILHVEHQQHLLSICYKWVGEPKVYTLALPEYALYHDEPHNDKSLAVDFWDVINAADVVVGHNSNSFDNKMVNSMFMRHKLPPPSPYKKVDTKLLAKKHGRFISNKLDDLGEEFDIGRKLKHQGFDLWLGCDAGDKKCWKKMLEYNRQDVRLTEKLYLELRPWDTASPPLNVIDDRPKACPKCGHEVLQSRGIATSKTNTYQRYQCVGCGGWCRSRAADFRQAGSRMEFVNG